jgi:hypothetical protein
MAISRKSPRPAKANHPGLRKRTYNQSRLPDCHRVPFGPHGEEEVEVNRLSGALTQGGRRPSAGVVVQRDKISWPTRGPNVDWTIGSTMRSRSGRRTTSGFPSVPRTSRTAAAARSVSSTAMPASGTPGPKRPEVVSHAPECPRGGRRDYPFTRPRNLLQSRVRESASATRCSGLDAGWQKAPRPPSQDESVRDELGPEVVDRHRVSRRPLTGSRPR